MKSFLHKAAIVIGGLGTILPTADVMPPGTPKCVRVGSAVVGSLALILGHLDKAFPRNPPNGVIPTHRMDD